MRNYALIIEAGMAALSLVMVVVLGVVLLLYGVYLNQAPSLAEELPAVLRTTLLFAGLTVTWGGAACSLYRRHWSTWLLQPLAVAVLIGLVRYIQLLRG